MSHSLPYASTYYEITKKDDTTIEVTEIDVISGNQTFEVTPNANGVYDLNAYTSKEFSYLVDLKGTSIVFMLNFKYFAS